MWVYWHIKGLVYWHIKGLKLDNNKVFVSANMELGYRFENDDHILKLNRIIFINIIVLLLA